MALSILLAPNKLLQEKEQAGLDALLAEVVGAAPVQRLAAEENCNDKLDIS